MVFSWDRQRAANIFRDVANQGDPEAAYNYGVMRLNGQDGNPPDEQAAINTLILQQQHHSLLRLMESVYST